VGHARIGAAVLSALLCADFLPRLDLRDVWTSVPSVYSRLPVGAVVTNLPFGGPSNWDDTVYMYWSTGAWPRLVNGGSGFEPRWYAALRQSAAAFPSDRTLDDFARVHTQYFVLHSGYYRLGYQKVIADAEHQPRLRHVTTTEWEEGEIQIFQLIR
jgi:hypothetical protein